MKLGQLADLLECRLHGDADRDVCGIASVEQASPTDLSFFTDARMLPAARRTQAAALVVGLDLDVDAPVWRREPARPPLAWLRTKLPELAVARAVELLRPQPRPAAGVHPTASVDPTAVIGRDCHIGAFVAVGPGCRLGDGSVLYPHVVLYPDVHAGARLTAHAHAVIREGTRLGDDVVLQPGVVLGGDGFGFVRRPDGSYAKVPQTGTVQLGNRVEVQANSCIDRASLDTTRIGAGVKIDNLVQVAHNCQLADNVLLCAQVGVAGSTVIEEGALLAGQAGVAGHCTVGKGTVVTAQSGTHGDLEPGKVYSGSPAFDHAQWLRSTAAFARLGELQRELRQVRQQLQRLLQAQPSSPGE